MVANQHVDNLQGGVASTICLTVGDCGKTGRKNGAMERPNIRVRRGTYNIVKLEKGEMSWAVRSYADVTGKNAQTPLGQNRLIIP